MGSEGWGLITIQLAKQGLKSRYFSEFYPNIPFFHHSIIPFGVLR
ncbi:hypothetical protein D1BOALGB6SA_9614 [Olavius sp. associated proteobacterium Delta 1]|nr:hypothetical protein D1BOALGB6SA_9614 [Olavius sp. associated proteobacterium Delta 1]